MKRIESFNVDHTKLEPGFYVSRIDGDITTYDMRAIKPNTTPLLTNSEMHSFEHMFTTIIRNGSMSEKIIYFGPMGCQTGFYLCVRNSDNVQTVAEVEKTLNDILEHNGEMFGNSEIECGNYRSLDINNAKKVAKNYLNVFNGLNVYEK